MADASLFDPSTNAKTTLVEFCQRFTGKSMGKDSIVYTSEEFSGQYQVTVRLNCFEGKEWAGELAASQKEAEQLAARQACIGCEAEVTGILSRKRSREGSGGLRASKVAKVSDDVELPDLMVKSQMREAVKQIIKRDLNEGDFVYDFVEKDGIQQCTLKLPSLPGGLGSQTWVGHSSPYKRDTMLVAAKKALETILADPIALHVDLTKVPTAAAKKEMSKKKPKADGEPKAASKGGKGKGKGKGFGKGMMMGPGFGMMMMEMMNGVMMGKGGKGW